MLIAGMLVSSSEHFTVINPATAEVAGLAPQCSSTQLDQAFVAAASAFPAWANRTPEERGAILLTAVEQIDASREHIAALYVSELGKPTKEALAEVEALNKSLRYYANLTLLDTTIDELPGIDITVTHRPLGVVAALTPWNAALSLLGEKMGSALAAGNTLVAKPSPYTPLSTLRVGEVLADVFPPGVINIVSGEEPLGAAMVSHRTPRKISFTGSSPVGTKIAAAAAQDLKRLTLELGGNDAAIVLPDADVAFIADRIFAAAFRNCGQGCAAIKRVYVVGDAYRSVVDALAARADQTRVGDPLDPDTEVGPCATEAQRAHVQNLIADAIQRNARIAAGGKPIVGPGYFHELTIIADVTDGARVVDEEQFGPVLPIIKCDSVDEAVRRSNSGIYGLGASVWSSDVENAKRVAAQLDAGTVWINAHRAFTAMNQPFGGWKSSGVGIERGRWGLEGMTQVQTQFYVPA